jgi:glutamyl-tRNA reductase
MLRDPITRMKELANHPNREEIYKLIEYIFAIEEENSCTVEEEKDSYVPLVFAEKLTMS